MEGREGGRQGERKERKRERIILWHFCKMNPLGITRVLVQNSHKAQELL
jgi:hypothetical protein